MVDVGRRGEPGYVALIGDMIASRALSRRAEVQRDLEALLDELNEHLPGVGLAGPARSAAPWGFASKLVLTTGDEFQGLFHEPGMAVHTASLVQERMHPHGFRFGLGYGALATALKPRAIGMDGPCFHRARAALDHQRRSGGPGLTVRGFGAAADKAASAIAALVAAVRAEWTDRQVEFITALRSASTQREVAERFDVSPSVVSESLAAAKYKEVAAAEDALGIILGEAMLEERTAAGGRHP